MASADRRQSYYEEFLRRRSAEAGVNAKGNPLLTDRAAYISYLEVQLERVTSACMTVQTLRDRLDEVQTSVSSLEDRMQQAGRVIKLTQSLNEDREKTELKEIHDIRDNLLTEIKQLQGRFQHINGEMDVIQKRSSEEIRAARSDFDRRILDSSSECRRNIDEENARRIEFIESKLTQEFQTKVEELRVQMRSNTESIVQTEGKIRRLADRELGDDLRPLFDQVAAKVRELESGIQDWGRLEARLTRIDARIADSEERQQAFEGKVKEGLKRSVSDVQHKLESQFAGRFSSTEEAVRDAIVHQKQALKRSKMRVDELEVRIEAALSSTEKQCIDLAGKIDMLHDRAAMRGDVDDCRRAVDKVSARVDGVNIAVDQLKQAQGAVHDNVNDMKNRISEIQADVQGLQSLTSQHRGSESNRRNQELQQLESSVKRQLMSVERAVHAQEARLDEWRSPVDSLRTEMRSLVNGLEQSVERRIKGVADAAATAAVARTPAPIAPQDSHQTNVLRTRIDDVDDQIREQSRTIVRLESDFKRQQHDLSRLEQAGKSSQEPILEKVKETALAAARMDELVKQNQRDIDDVRGEVRHICETVNRCETLIGSAIHPLQRHIDSFEHTTRAADARHGDSLAQLERRMVQTMEDNMFAVTNEVEDMKRQLSEYEGRQRLLLQQNEQLKEIVDTKSREAHTLRRMVDSEIKRRQDYLLAESPPSSPSDDSVRGSSKHRRHRSRSRSHGHSRRHSSSKEKRHHRPSLTPSPSSSISSRSTRSSASCHDAEFESRARSPPTAAVAPVKEKTPKQHSESPQTPSNVVRDTRFDALLAETHKAIQEQLLRLRDVAMTPTGRPVGTPSFMVSTTSSPSAEQS